MALLAGEPERLGARGAQVRVFGRIDRLLRVPAQVGEQQLCVGVARRLDPRHHLGHQPAHVPLAAHAQHHPLDDRRPFRRVVHGRVGEVVALHAITDGEARARRAGLGQHRRLEARRQDALEHRPVRAAGPALARRLEFVGCLRAARKRRRGERHDDAGPESVHRVCARSPRAKPHSGVATALPTASTLNSSPISAGESSCCACAASGA